MSDLFSKPKATQVDASSAQANSGPAAEPSTLAAAQAQANEYLQGWQRARADYANLKRASEARQLELTRYAQAQLLRDLLPLVDYFKHALHAVPQDKAGEPWVEGIRHIQTKLLEVLAYHGVKELDTVGEKFDPSLHEAVVEVEGSGQSAGVIVEEVRGGFMLHDRLLQPARVKVAK